MRGVASALNGLGDVAAAQGDHDAARRHHHQSLAGTATSTIGGALRGCSRIWPASTCRRATIAAANRSLKQALEAFRALGHQRGVARQLESLSWCAGCQARDEEAIVLASAAAAIRLRIGTPAKQAERDKVERTLSAARDANRR